MKDKKVLGKNILLIVVGILFVGIVGFSFAYYTTFTDSSGSGLSTDGATSKSIEVTYDAGSSSLTASNLYPGKSVSKSFTVSVIPGSNQNTVTYAIIFDISKNTFVKCSSSNYNTESNVCVQGASELTYILKDSSGNVIKTGDLTGLTGKVTLGTENKTVNTTTNYSYTVEIVFNEVSGAQNHNENKSIEGNIKIEF